MTGPVIRPGQYAGQSSDSVLYFSNGRVVSIQSVVSYRQIKVSGQNQVLQQIDLYEFMHQRQNAQAFPEGSGCDPVEPQGPMINVAGRFATHSASELKQRNALGPELGQLCPALAKVSHVGVIGDRANGPFSIYLPYKDFARSNSWTVTGAVQR